MGHYRTADETAEALRWAVSRLSARLRSVQSRDHTPLTRLGVSVLANAKASGPHTASQLAAMEGVQRQSLTRVLNSLEAADLIKRSPSDSDGREQDIAITSGGRDALDDHVRSGNEWLAEALGQLTTPERAVVAIAADLILGLANSPRALPANDGAPPPL